MRADRLLVTALGLAVVLCACGGGEDGTVSSGPSSVGPSSSSGVGPSEVGRATPEPSLAAAGGDCPEQVPLDAGALWVPESPTTETPGRLVPDADPVEALVCRYRPGAGTSAVLVDGVLLEAGLDRIRTELAPALTPAGPRRACDAGDGPPVPHLVRLRYADGELWLAAPQVPGDCAASGNGVFVTGTYLGDRFAEAYDERAWPEP